jgi:predicted outer membrane repeat protein
MLGTFAVVSPASADDPIQVTNNFDDGRPGTIRQALLDAAAHPGPDTITFYGDFNEIVVTAPLVIDSPVAIVANGNFISGGGARQIFQVTSGTVASIQRMVVRNGAADAGGAIAVAGDLTLRSVNLQSNTADSGGAIAVSSTGKLTLEARDAEFEGDEPDPTSFTGNTATDGDGGAISVDGGDLVVQEGTTFSQNVSDGQGGAIAASAGADVAVTDATFLLNHAGGLGGAISATSSPITAARSTFTENWSDNGDGGAIGALASSVRLTSSTMQFNAAQSGQGGSIWASESDTTIVGSVIRWGVAHNGGAVASVTASSGGTLTITESTIFGNNQTDGGSAAQVVAHNVGDLVVRNSILANSAAGGDLDAQGRDGASIAYSWVQVPVGSDLDQPLDDSSNIVGGDTGIGGDDEYPVPSRAVVDAGDPDYDGDLTTDIRGEARVVGDAIDMGAVELRSAGEPVLTLSNDTGASSSDGVTNADDLEFAVTGAAEGTETQLYRDEVAVVDGGGEGNGSVYDSTPLEGEHEYAIKVVGEAGDVITDPITVVTDWSVPVAPDVPDLDGASDHGTSSTDDFTSATTRTFDLSGVEPDATVTLRQAYTGQGPCIPMPFFPYIPICPPPSTQYDSHSRTGNGTIEESHPPTGLSAPYDAVQTDLAGNTSDYSSSLTVTFDFAAPAVPNAPDLQDASDDGSSHTDNQTRQRNLTFEVTGIDPGATAKLIRADGQSGGEVASRVGNGTITDTNVPVGDHTYSVVAMDAAGNESYDSNRSIVVTVQALPVFVPEPTTTTTTPPTTTPPTTVAPNASTTPATTSNPTPRPGETVQLKTAAPAGGNSAGNTASSLDATKPSTAILLSTNGSADRPMPTPVITKNADGSTSISVQVPPSTPPGVYLIAVMGTTPSGQSRVIIVPVVVRRTAAATARAASVPASTATVPAVARSIQASVTALGGSAAVEQAVVQRGATLSIAGDRLIVDSHPAGGHSPIGPAAMVGLLLAAVALIRRSTRLNRSAR